MRIRFKLKNSLRASGYVQFCVIAGYMYICGCLGQQCGYRDTRGSNPKNFSHEMREDWVKDPA